MKADTSQDARSPHFWEAIMLLFSLVTGISISIVFCGFDSHFPVLLVVVIATIVTLGSEFRWQNMQIGMLGDNQLVASHDYYIDGRNIFTMIFEVVAWTIYQLDDQKKQLNIFNVTVKEKQQKVYHNDMTNQPYPIFNLLEKTI